MNSKRVFIRTYGCQMNERDSEAALAALIKRGYVTADREEDADILIFNTCSVRDQAERKSMGKLGIVIRLKKAKPELIIGVMGCMAQSRGEEILKKIPHVDFVIGTDQLHKLPGVVDEMLVKRSRRALTQMDDPDILSSMSDHLDYNPDMPRVSASVAIMRGCSRHCAYCIVPSVRGPERSRPIADILAEIQSLVDTGVCEILLLGQNVAAYGHDNKAPPLPDDYSPFADLLETVSKIPGLRRIRFTSPHPAYFNRKLIEAIARLPKVCNHVHLPVQSGSDRILKRMNRPYTQAHYFSVIDQLRTLIPGVSFSTDIIVGFPGETDEDFEETCKVMRFSGYANAYIFKYSPRKNTPAAVMEDQVEQSVKELRNQILLDELAKSSEQYNRSLVGTVQEILVEGPSKRNPARWAGRTVSNGIVVFTPPENIKIGDVIHLLIDRATSMTLFGSLVESGKNV